MQLDEPLSDKEFDQLDQLLLSDDVPGDAMTMDILHGYLTAIVIGPEVVPMSEWLPKVWGEDSTFHFGDEKEAKRILQLIIRFMNEIAITFEVAPKEFEPLFCERDWEGKTLIDGEAWAYGFWEGMNLRPDAWEPLWSSDAAELMRPIYLLGDGEIEEDEAVLVEDPVKRHKLAIEIEANIPLIYRFWLQRRKSGLVPEKRESPKVGRNDPCQCGSGKKSKKCCGQIPKAD